MGKPTNIIFVISDTLRTAFLGCYGNDWVITPNIDRFAAESVLFGNAHPESLPTIPMRRAIHTGCRAYPFNDYRPIPWDNVYLPGWQPMGTEEPTIAEILASAGYHNGFFSDVPHFFVPGMNFTRGFHQFDFVRGQAEDHYRSIHNADPSLEGKYFDPDGSKGLRIKQHIVNVQPSLPEEEWPTARTFRAAVRFLEENTGDAPFFLYVDTFSPHETWEAPEQYYRLYGAESERWPIPLTVNYGPLSEQPAYRDRLNSLRANYAGMVTMVDRWFGELLSAVDRLGRRDDTLVIFTSDHGTNHGDNPEEVLGKPAAYMYPGTMDVPLLIRAASGDRAGTRRDELVYTMDIASTILAAAGVSPLQDLDGYDLLPLVEGEPKWSGREYLTCRYGNYVWYKDVDSYLFSDLEFNAPKIFDLAADPACTHDIGKIATDRRDRARDRVLADAGGNLVDYTEEWMTDALGRPGFRSTPGVSRPGRS